VASPPRLDSLASREGVFLLNNLLLAVFAFVVIIGTIYPLILEAFSGDRVSVGAPWFDRAAIPLSLVLLLAMGLGPLTPYRFAAPDLMWRRIRGPLQAASILAAATVLAGVRPITVVATIWLAAFIVSGIAGLAHQRARAANAGYARALGSLFRTDPGFWGGMVSHIGVALLAVGIAFSGSFVARQTIEFVPGESAPFDGYTLTYEGPTQRDEPNRRVIGALFTLSRGDTVLGTLEPRLNQYPNQVQAIPTPSVRTGLREDVYLSLVRIDPDRVTIDAFRFPLMWLLWSGALLIVTGGGWSFIGRKRRRQLSAAEAATVA
jgi:cytochrome c-type biogenesis protein CcmF